MTWFETVPTFLAAALIIFVPGAILARALGARGLTWLALAAPLSVSLAVLGPIAANFVHLRWNPLVLAVLTLGVSAMAWGLRRSTSKQGRRTAKASWSRSSTAMLFGALGGLLFGGTVIAVRFMRIFGAPENISQTYDNVFHLNAIRFIMDTGNGSSVAMGNLDLDDPSGTYPFAWHNLVALVAELSSSPIPVAVNSVNVVIGALVWIISSMYLASRLAGPRPAILLMTGILAGAFGAFPYWAVGWGVLYPNFLAIALLPAFIGLAADLLRLSASPRLPIIQTIVLLAIAVPGLALAHPNMLMTLGAFVAPMLLFWFARCVDFRRQRNRPWRLVAFAGLAVALYLALFLVAWDRIRPSVAGSSWPPFFTMPVALVQALTTSPLDIPLSWPILVLTIFGLVSVCIKRHQLWALGPYLVGIMFYIVVSSFPAGAFRHAITGVFFNDSNRLAALLPVMALPLTAMGAVWAFDLVMARIPHSVLSRRPLFVVAVSIGMLAGVAVGVAAQNNAVTSTQTRTNEYYVYSPASWLLTSDEAALISRLPTTVPPDATVIGNPAAGGASLAYALADRRVALMAISSYQSALLKTINQHLPDMAENPAVCQAARELGTFHLLDFGRREVRGIDPSLPTSDDLANTPGLTLLDHEGLARLYRIDGCQ
ncbi:DUF6541 family protein [Specibacter sp. AOP5-B1-6]|uniref:DUF6541 family protein n=1 Tax=Specibacter sp. AOP5-B1-6 TaxID=3457653 RepID=UPI00402B9B49